MDNAEFQILKERARHDDAEAHHEIGRMYLNGENVPCSEVAAYSWFKSAAFLGHRESQYIIGNRFFEKESYEEAVEWLEKAADQGHIDAQNQLGDMYAHGQGVRLSLRKAAEWYEMAALQGDPEGVGGLARTAERGSSYALDGLTALAKRGDPNAQTRLGSIYRWGFGAELSSEIAASLYEKAALQGNAEAQCQLGRMCFYGNGVEQSDEDGAAWIEKAAVQGNAEAQNLLGDAYSDGRGVKQSYVEAAKWYRKAAEQGDFHAQMSLASLYEQGLGVGKSIKEARSWFEEASKQGNKRAKREFQRLDEQVRESGPEEMERPKSPLVEGPAEGAVTGTPSEEEPPEPASIENADRAPDYTYDDLTWNRLNGRFPHTLYEQTAQVLDLLCEEYGNGIHLESGFEQRRIGRRLGADRIPEKVWNEVKEHMFSPSSEYSDDPLYHCWGHVITEEGLKGIWNDVNRTVGSLGLYEPKAVFEMHSDHIGLEALQEPNVQKKMMNTVFPEFEGKAITTLFERAWRTLSESLAEFISEEYGGRISFDKLDGEGFAVSFDKLKRSALNAPEILVVENGGIRTVNSVTVPDRAYDEAERFLEGMRGWGITVGPDQMREMLNKSFGTDVQEEWHVPDSFFENLLKRTQNPRQSSPANQTTAPCPQPVASTTSILTFDQYYDYVLAQLSDGHVHHLSEIRDAIAKETGVSKEERSVRLPSGEPKFTNRVRWSVIHLFKAGMVARENRGMYKITERGRVAVDRGEHVGREYLLRFPEYREYVEIDKRRRQEAWLPSEEGSATSPARDSPSTLRISLPILSMSPTTRAFPIAK